MAVGGVARAGTTVDNGALHVRALVSLNPRLDCWFTLYPVNRLKQCKASGEANLDAV